MELLKKKSISTLIFLIRIFLVEKNFKHDLITDKMCVCFIQKSIITSVYLSKKLRTSLSYLLINFVYIILYSNLKKFVLDFFSAFQSKNILFQYPTRQDFEKNVFQKFKQKFEKLKKKSNDLRSNFSYIVFSKIKIDVCTMYQYSDTQFCPR